MRVGWWALVLAGLAAAISGQDTPPQPEAPPKLQILRNEGSPMKVAFKCTSADMESAGMSCSDEEPCPVYLELSAVEPVGNKIFVAGNIHSSSATLYSILLSSDDSGKTWIEPHERLRGAGLEYIQFIDFENGWITGQVLQPLPQDPFLLITSDSGKTWRQKPLFSETRAGAILQFWFSSRNEGSLVLDRLQSGDTGRYELYQTPNGGETWMLRETNERQIRLKRASGGNSDWRIRADARSKAFFVERKQGERWGGLGAFAVALPPCKAVAEAAPPPPPDEEPDKPAKPAPAAPGRAPRPN